jgi:cytochrome P450 / NADPH-cytochrome P450 reductase
MTAPQSIEDSVATPLTVDDIPGPDGLPVVGNMFTIPAKRTVQTLMEIVREYGPMVRLQTPVGDRFVASGLAMIDDLCDDERFDKLVGDGQKAVRKFGRSSGLFTSDTDDPNWGKAHNILLPNFSTQAMRDYVPMMNDIASQLMQKWERLNPGELVDVTADMTRLTLDTIALCGFGYRFNSFYRDTQHPFVDAMMVVLQESQIRARQLPVQARLRRRATRRLQESYQYMANEVQKIIDERRRGGNVEAHKDLLSAMLTGVDKRTGEKLSDDNIVAQCETFLIAGHETTSGLLSFAINYLIKNPDVVARAQEEVDRVLGTDPSVLPTYQQIQGLTYVTQILNETLRLWPTAAAFTRYPYEDAMVGGYLIPKGSSITALTIMLHRDKSIWGEDAEEFNPDHFQPETRASLPANAYKPFGSGQRACIGRQFAMQEAVLVLGMLLQRFEFIDQLNYQLKIRESLTIKPDGLLIGVRLRPGRTTGATPVVAAAAPSVETAPAPRPAVNVDGHNTPLMVLFGSNLGTAEGIASRIAQDGSDRGFAVTLGALDDHTGELPRDGALVVVCASYNGKPPDNAERFCRWITDSATPSDAGSGLVFSVFGCGNMDWASTYQAVPTLIDTQLEAHGARRVHARGEGDARSDFDGQFSEWYSDLWSSVADSLALSTESTTVTTTEPRLRLTMENKQTANPVVMSYRAHPSTLVANRELLGNGQSASNSRSARHIELELPAGMEYQTGDHLGVLPRNNVDVIRRVMARFGLDAGTYVTINPTGGGTYTHLPLGEPAPLLGILGACVELQDVASRSDLAVLARYATDPDEAAQLLTMSGLDEAGREAYRERVAGSRRSVLELMDEFPSCDLPFNVYLELLPPMRPRYYSISSSPAVASSCHLTVGVLHGPARSGDGYFNGVASNHLASSMEGSTQFTFVRKPTIPFRPPANPHVPMIMVGAGTGMAPFRGFLQERAALAEKGVPVGKSMLFYGCRYAKGDMLYADELKAFEESGITELQMAFSREPGQPRTFVQQVIERERDQVWDLIEAGAVIYVCGNANTMAPGVRAVLMDVYRARTNGSDSSAEDWLQGLRDADRYLEDIWGEMASGL